MNPGSESSAPRVESAGSTDALPIAPALGLALDVTRMPRRSTLVDRRILLIATAAILIAIAAALIARFLTALIGVVTNLAFYSRWSTEFSSPAGNHLGAWVIVVPVIGGLIVGAMARWGSQAIRGHGIPEAMEQVLLNQSKIAPRITFLKPILCPAFRGKGDFPNLTARKIPKQVLSRCEWGHDDYSLQVENLPKAPEPDEPPPAQAGLFTEGEA